MAEQVTRIKAPEVYPEDAPYWEAAAAGKLLLKHCNSCGQDHHYPRTFCPFCMSRDVEWREAAGTGTIYTYTVLRRTPEKRAPAFVTLDEGPTVLSAIVNCDVDAIAVGQRVRVVFAPTDGGPPVPMFEPMDR